MRFAYLKQFHVSIWHKKGNSNKVTNCLSRPPNSTLLMLLDSCGHEMTQWSDMYTMDDELSESYTQTKER